MKEFDMELVLQRAREKFPGVTPRIISDNGPQFIAKELKQFIRICSMTHVRTGPNYPQNIGKLERWHRTINSDCSRPGTPLSLEDSRRIVYWYPTGTEDKALLASNLNAASGPMAQTASYLSVSSFVQRPRRCYLNRANVSFVGENSH
jgi:transposase InsO family protein